jgi:hypothetical protein
MQPNNLQLTSPNEDSQSKVKRIRYDRNIY